MRSPKLRVFPSGGPIFESDDPQAAAISVKLADLYPLLAQAHQDNYVWLRDLEDEEILISEDLHEIVRAFADCRPSA